MEREERAGGHIGRKDNMFSAGLLFFFVGREMGFNLPVCSLIFMMEDSRRRVDGMAVMMEEWTFYVADLLCRAGVN